MLLGRGGDCFRQRRLDQIVGEAAGAFFGFDVIEQVVAGLGDRDDDVLDFFFNAEVWAGGDKEDFACVPGDDVFGDDGANEPGGHVGVVAADADPAGRFRFERVGREGLQIRAEADRAV